MLKEKRKIFFDKSLNIEMLEFYGVHQSFPKHFHDYYVIGFIKNGHRNLICNSKKYEIKKSSILLLNPNDYHECVGINEQQLDYIAFHISNEEMQKIANEIFNENKKVIFVTNTIDNFEYLEEFKELSVLLKNNSQDLRKEELFYFLIQELLEKYANFKDIKPNNTLKTNVITDYIEKHFSDNISLDDLSKISSVSKYHLIRLFTKEKGITPYKYLELYRINQAKKLLATNESIITIAMECGFSDQSHFTNLFKKTIGITPKQYQQIFEERNLK